MLLSMKEYLRKDDRTDTLRTTIYLPLTTRPFPPAPLDFPTISRILPFNAESQSPRHAKERIHHMPSETMTPRERWLAVLRREKPDRVPMDYQATPEATAKLKAHLGVQTDRELFDLLHIDARIGLGPSYAGPPLPEGTDEFGCRFRNVDYGTGVYGECVHHPLAGYSSVDQIESSYSWPTVDLYDFSRIPAQVKAARDLPTVGGGSEPFLTYANLRGLELAMMDLALCPEIVHYCLDRLFNLCYQKTSRIYEAANGDVLVSYVAEDMGSQQGLLFSPAHIEEFLLPRMKRMIDLAHSSGVYVMHHNDGAVRDILPRMIDIGIDILNPVQWPCAGMDRQALKNDFGKQIVFHGAVDNQHTLPFGTPADVRDEVVENLRILGAGGGYIIGPCHNIQAVGPVENVVAMYETGYNEGWT